jgi:hypothetical protein
VPQTTASVAPSSHEWKAKFGGTDICGARGLVALEDGNARLKKVVANLSLYDAMLKDIASKKMVTNRLSRGPQLIFADF